MFVTEQRRLSFCERRGRRGDGRKRGRGRGRVRGAHGERGRAVPRRRAAVGRGIRAAALPLPAAAAPALRSGAQSLHAAPGTYRLNIQRETYSRDTPEA